MSNQTGMKLIRINWIHRPSGIDFSKTKKGLTIKQTASSRTVSPSRPSSTRKLYKLTSNVPPSKKPNVLSAIYRRTSPYEHHENFDEHANINSGSVLQSKSLSSNRTIPSSLTWISKWCLRATHICNARMCNKTATFNHHIATIFIQAFCFVNLIGFFLCYFPSIFLSIVHS